jgi:hypothetical protein
VLKLDRQSSSATITNVARGLLGSTLLLSILATNIPASAITNGSICNLACCAGRAPHAAGSCMNGSCHAFLKGRVKTSRLHRQLPAQQSEQLCGLSLSGARTTARLLRRSSTVTLGDSSGQSHGSRAPEAESVSTLTLGKPCQSDCGAGTFSSWSQSRPRDTGAISYADKLRPPSTKRPTHCSFNPARTLAALCRRSRPRGPPIAPS